ncbi:MAG: YdcF family protein [Clostridia bacterium]|nr:YdcF family protein [Clostridia bacterium]
MFKKVRRIIFFVIIGVVLACICALFINVNIVKLTRNNVYAIDNIKADDYDCVIVLGAGVRADNSVSDVLRDRLDTAIELYKNGVVPKLLMSGDHGKKEYDEVNAMKNYVLEKTNIPSDDIFMDHAGFSTYESIYRARDIFEVDKAVIVTQKFHLPRALYIARLLGINAVGVEADMHRYKGYKYFEFREFLARVKEFINLIIKPEPKFLGEVIPVSGNGNITNDK